MADGVIVLPDDSGNTGKDLDATSLTVGTNTVYRQRVQQGYDTNRTFVAFTLNETVVAVTTATLASCIQNSQGTTATATNYTVPTGKTLRIGSWDVHMRLNSSTTAVNYAQFWLVGTSSGTVATTMTTTQVLDRITCGIPSGAGATNLIAINGTDHPEGMEIPAGWNIGIVYALGVATSAALGLSMNCYTY